MTYTSDRPITVDGVRLDTLAWNITKISRATAARRSADQVVPGRDGLIPSLNDDLEATTFGLEMFVMGTSPDGSVPPEGRRDKFQANLDELIHLFGTRHRLLDIQEASTTAAAVTNWVKNPNLELDTRGWSSPNTEATFERESTSGLLATEGSFLGKVSFPQGVVQETAFLRSDAAPASPGQKWSAESRIGRSNSGTPSGVKLAIIFQNSTGATLSEVRGPIVYSSTGAPAALNYGKVEGAVAPAGTTQVRMAWITLSSSASTGTAWRWDGNSLTQTQKAVTYFDGASTAIGFIHAWSGEAHWSYSTRRPIYRRAKAKVSDSIQPDLNAVGSSGMFTVALNLPYAVWEDDVTGDFTGPDDANGTAWTEVTHLRGLTERVMDAVVLVTGPISNPRVTDMGGSYVELQATLAAGEAWRVNVDTWATRRGTGLTLASSDTTGTDSQSVTVFGGAANQSAFLPITPIRSGAADPTRRAYLRLQGTSRAASTRLLVRARRKFAL